MKKKDIIRIINEEVSNSNLFDYEYSPEELELIEILTNEEFQKQFICDSLSYNYSKIKLKEKWAKVGGNYDDSFEDARYITLDYALAVEYKYDLNKKPVNFELFFYGDDIEITKSGWYNPGRFGGTPDTDIEPEGKAWLSHIDWDAIEVSLHISEDYDQLPFTAFQKAPQNVKMLFIRNYTADLIIRETYLDIKTPEMKINSKNISYC